jgi:hypothetical protein
MPGVMIAAACARRKNAADVAISTTFGPNFLETFRVWTDELVENPVGELQQGSYLDERYGHAN